MPLCFACCCLLLLLLVACDMPFDSLQCDLPARGRITLKNNEPSPTNACALERSRISLLVPFSLWAQARAWGHRSPRSWPLRRYALLVVVVLLLLAFCLCRGRALWGKNGGYISGPKWGSSDERNRVGKIAHFSPGPFSFSTEFQDWRGRIPEKWSKNGPFPLGGDGL